MRAIFLADAHLRRPDEHNYQALQTFLARLEGRADLLVILGDLFEFLIGYPVREFPHYLPVLDSLRRVRERGTRLVYCEGNHDFHLGSFFTGTLGAELHPGPAVLDLDGKRVHICHGDQINRSELPVRILRALLHGPLVRGLIPAVPARVACAIAERLGRRSAARRAKKKRRTDTRAMLIREYAAARFAEGCSAVITGHFHLPFQESSPDAARTLISLGEWISRYSYAEYRDGTFTLTSYEPPSPCNPNSPR